MANVNTRAHVLVRDGFRCRWCRCAIILSPAVKVLDWHVPGLDLYDAHGRREPLRSRWATVDHVIPQERGGLDTLDNLAACCVTCNSRKGNTIVPARPVTPESAPWDGLGHVFKTLAPAYADRLSVEDKKWLAAVCREPLPPPSASLDRVVEVLKLAKSVGPSALDELAPAAPQEDCDARSHGA